MKKQEFTQIRHHLGKTQTQMAQLLGVSLKAVQSFEQGWREIPISAERQLLLVLSMKSARGGKRRLCWVIKGCPMEIRRNCPAWEFGAGHLCWCINGTFCHGSARKSWAEKMRACRGCDVLKPLLTWDAPEGKKPKVRKKARAAAARA
jgi:DNA-binding XRE family transcriptional regulator